VCAGDNKQRWPSPVRSLLPVDCRSRLHVERGGPPGAPRDVHAVDLAFSALADRVGLRQRRGRADLRRGAVAPGQVGGDCRRGAAGDHLAGQPAECHHRPTGREPHHHGARLDPVALADPAYLVRPSIRAGRTVGSPRVRSSLNVSFGVQVPVATAAVVPGRGPLLVVGRRYGDRLRQWEDH